MKSNYKNPLLQALGMFLKSYRLSLNKTVNEIVSDVGVGAAFYRLLESGTNHIHINKSLNLVNAFEGNLSFEGMIKLLSSISIMQMEGMKSSGEDGGSYINGLQDATRKLMAYDEEKIKPLLFRFDEDLLPKMKKREVKIKDWIIENSFQNTIGDFLLNYNDFGKKPEEVEERKHEELQKFMHKVPSIYLDIMLTLKEELINLPVRLSNEDTFKWENSNSEKFTSLYAIVEDSDIILESVSNEKFSYPYLFESTFIHGFNIIFLDDKKEEDVKNEFCHKLKTELKNYSENELDSAIKKVNFRKCSKEVAKNILLLKSMNKSFNTIYLFTMVNRFTVGFAAAADAKSIENMQIDGISLSYKESKDKLTQLSKLWDTL